jgi:hypothetical protein
MYFKKRTRSAMPLRMRSKDEMPKLMKPMHYLALIIAAATIGLIWPR